MRLALAHRLLADPQVGRYHRLGLAIPEQPPDQPAMGAAEPANEPANVLRGIGWGRGIVRSRTILQPTEIPGLMRGNRCLGKSPTELS